ncbi:MAG: cytidylate kinase-like family protein [Phycisphaerales bacterium]|nr:cytidylate kinase-like family protein [Phycisphaerales bacterium]
MNDQMSPPVVTISRQTGTDAAGIARRLAEVLSERQGGDQPWLAFDQELVQRVADDHDLPEEMVSRFSEHARTWFEDVRARFRRSASDTDVAPKTAQLIRELATVGRAVIVGRGGQCILADHPGAIHVRLNAPLLWRAERYAASAGLAEPEVERALRHSDAVRVKFIKHHFKRDIGDPDMYHVVLNMAVVSPERAVDFIAQLVLSLQEKQ